MTFKAVLFDLDGTLLDTLEDLADSANAALERLGLTGLPIDAFRRLIGDGADNLAYRILPPAQREPPLVAQCAALVRAEYALRWADKTRPYSGIPELLDALTARGLPLAVLSNKPDDFARLCVERLLPRWRFAVVLGATPSRPLKPDPAGALAIASQLQLAQAEILYVGDTNTDMRTALAAGMFPVGALWGFRTAEELQASGAKVLLDQPASLLNLLA